MTCIEHMQFYIKRGSTRLQALHTATKLACTHSSIQHARLPQERILHLSLARGLAPGVPVFYGPATPSNCAIVIASESVSIEWWKFQFLFPSQTRLLQLLSADTNDSKSLPIQALMSAGPGETAMGHGSATIVAAMTRKMTNLCRSWFVSNLDPCLCCGSMRLSSHRAHRSWATA